MFERIFSNSYFQMVEKALDASTLRHNILANNIANVNTPGYKRSDVIFEEELSHALDTGSRHKAMITHRGHIPFGGGTTIDRINPKVVQENQLSFRNDLNNVDIDAEMAELSENSLTYNALSQQMAKNLQMLRTVIQGR